jgi:hypothetical protein
MVEASLGHWVTVEQERGRACSGGADEGQGPMEARSECGAQVSGHGMRVKGAEQFEVFAVVQRVRERAACGDRNGFGMQIDLELAGDGHTSSILGQAVTEVHHGRWLAVGDEPARFVNARLHMEVTARRQRTAEGTGDGNTIAGLGAMAVADGLGFHSAEDDDGKRENRAADGVATDEADMPVIGGAPDAFQNAGDALEWQVGRQRGGDDGVGWHTAHGGDVADINSEGFPTDTQGIVLQGKMGAGDDGIDGDELEHVAVREAEDSGVIADAECDIGWAIVPATEHVRNQVDDGLFAVGGDSVTARA